MTIRTYKSGDHNEVVALWSNCFGYQAAHNKPEDSIRRKTAKYGPEALLNITET